MISIVCVWHKKDVLESVLLPSLKKQTSPYELVLIDNTKNQYPSVAAALNVGGKMCTKGKYLMFVHQDVDLISPTWLADVEPMLDSLRDLGIAGVAGASLSGGVNLASHSVGWIKSGDEEGGRKIARPERVQTVDELLMIIPKAVFSRVQFDEKRFDFMHLHGVDYCLAVAGMGLNTYVIPAYVHHRSKGSFVDIHKYQLRFAMKHFDKLPVFTTCGEISVRKMPNIVAHIFLPGWFIAFLRKIRDTISHHVVI